jgi:hypothetical protein
VRDWDDVLFVVQTDARPQWSEIGDWMPLTRCSRTGGLVVHDPVLFQGSYEDCGVLPVISLIDLGSLLGFELPAPSPPNSTYAVEVSSADDTRYETLNKAHHTIFPHPVAQYFNDLISIGRHRCQRSQPYVYG